MTPSSSPQASELLIAVPPAFSVSGTMTRIYAETCHLWPGPGEMVWLLDSKALRMFEAETNMRFDHPRSGLSFMGVHVAEKMVSTNPGELIMVVHKTKIMPPPGTVIS